MVYGSLISRTITTEFNDKVYYAIVIFDLGLDSNYNAYLELEVIPETVGQYTGLKDKNGKEIYSGNILDGNIGKHIVRFGEFDNKKDYADHSDGVGFYLERDGKCNYSLNSSLIRIYNLEVIGNIYESPNLLK